MSNFWNIVKNVSLVDFELTKDLFKDTYNFVSTCLHLLNADITGVCQQMKIYIT